MSDSEIITIHVLFHTSHKSDLKSLLADFMIKNTNNSPSLFSNLSDILNQSHPLYRLADKIDWGKFETDFQPLYCQDNGRPGKPIRLMCGLLILKHLRKPVR